MNITIIGLDWQMTNVTFVWLLLNPRPSSRFICWRKTTVNIDFNQRNLLKLTHFYRHLAFITWIHCAVMGNRDLFYLPKLKTMQQKQLQMLVDSKAASKSFPFCRALKRPARSSAERFLCWSCLLLHWTVCVPTGLTHLAELSQAERHNNSHSHIVVVF